MKKMIEKNYLQNHDRNHDRDHDRDHDRHYHWVTYHFKSTLPIYNLG